MIMGIGVDTVNIERFERIITETPAFVRRIFTPNERSRNVRSQAVRFAAKEAVAKVLGAPAGLNWQDCEVAAAESGQPYLPPRPRARNQPHSPFAHSRRTHGYRRRYRRVSERCRAGAPEEVQPRKLPAQRHRRNLRRRSIEEDSLHPRQSQNPLAAPRGTLVHPPPLRRQQ